MWYQNLKKSKYTPLPNSFTLVWSILYLFILTSFILYLYSTGPYFIYGCLFFMIQLILNLSWAPVFFLVKKPIFSFVHALILSYFIFLTMIFFSYRNILSCMIFIPYIFWIIFAIYLIFYISEHNS